MKPTNWTVAACSFAFVATWIWCIASPCWLLGLLFGWLLALCMTSVTAEVPFVGVVLTIMLWVV